MGIIEIIGGVLIVALSIIIIVAVTAQETKGGLGSALAGDMGGGSFFDRNRGNTKEAMLVRATTICGLALVAVILVVLFAAL